MKRIIMVCILVLIAISVGYVVYSEGLLSSTVVGQENNEFKSDFDNIKKIMTNKKDDVFKKLGKDYQIVKKRDLPERYKYEKYGISVVIEESLADTDMSVALVECDNKVDINGAKLGMTFEEIEKILGEGNIRPIKKFEPDDASYALTYLVDDLLIWFGSDTEDGPTTKLQIRRYSGPK